MKKIKDNFDVMMKEVAKYIESHGGKAIVLGGVSVRKRSLKHKFTLEIDFIGKGPKKSKTP